MSGEVPILFGIVGSISDHKPLLEMKTHVVCVYWTGAPVRLVQEDTNLQRGCVAPTQVIERETGW